MANDFKMPEPGPSVRRESCCRAGLILALALLLTLLAASSGLALKRDAAGRPVSITVVLDDNYPPYIFRGESGEVQGILVDEWRAWQRATGIHADLQAMDWESAQKFMRAGKADVIDTIFRNEERARAYAFSKPYATLEVPVFFHKSLGGINDVSSLRGFTVGVKAGDAVINELKKNGIHSLKEYASYKDIIDAAKSGEIRVFSIDMPPALYYLYKYDLESEFRQSFVLYTGQFHRAVKKGDEELLRLVEEGFAAIPGATHMVIERRWLGAPIASGQTLRIVLLALAGIGALALILACFALVLRRRVRAKTAEIKLMLEELRSREGRFRTIFNSVNDLIFLHSWPDGRIVDVNQRTCEAFGYTREEVLGLPVGALSAGFAPYDQAGAMRLMTLAHTGAPQVAEWLAKARDGRLFWVEASIRQALLQDSEHILVSCRDISERKQAEELLADKEALLQAMLRNLPFDFWARDLNQRVILQSTESQRIWGDLGAGTSAEEHVDQGYRDRWHEINERALAGEVVAGDVEYALPNGERRLYHGLVAPILDGERVLGIMGINIDITERTLAEAALRENRRVLTSILNTVPQSIF